MGELTKLDELLKAINPDYVPPSERDDDDEVPPHGQEGREGFGGRTVHNMANHPVVRRKVERQKAWIEHMRLGKTVTECCDAVGITRRTYDNWRQADDWFKPAVDGARRELAERDLAAEGKLDRDYDGSFESFRRIFMGMETFPHMEELVDLLETAAPMSVTLVTFPPEHGKTSTVEDYICVPPDHEILTRDGFKTHDQLELGEQVMVFDPITHEERWEPLLDLTVLDYTGELLHLDRERGGSFRFTPDHRWPYESQHGVRGMKRSRDLSVRDRLPLKGELSEHEKSILSPRLAAILGWVVTDGSEWWDGNHWRAQIYQSPSKYLNEIIELCGTTPHKPKPNGVVTVPVSLGDRRELLEHYRGREDIVRIACHLSREAAEAMWQAMWKAEGHDTGRGRVWTQNPNEVREAFQILSQMTGRNLGITDGMNCTVRAADDIIVGHPRAERYEGVVWCPTTPTGTWVMRHDGNVIPTGNCWKLGEDADYRFGFVSEKQHHGKKVIGRVQHRMTDHRFAKYQGRFGPFEPTAQGLDLPWRSEYMTVAGRSSDERDYSLVATGWRTAVSGSRYDKLLVDDIQSIKSQGLSSDIAEALRQDHFTRVGKNGAIVLIATRVGEGDVYETLMNEGVIDHHVKYPAVRAKADPTCPACDGSGTVGDPETDPDMPPAVIKRGGWTCNCRVLCPQMWDGRSLDLRRKQVGERIWWTTYQQAPQAASRSTFDKSMLEGCRREDLHVGATALPSDRYPRSVLLGLDPALDGGNALTALACSQTDAIIVDIQVDYGLAQTERIIAGIEDFASRYKPREVVIEQMAFQKGLVNDERLREMANTYGFHIIGHETRLNKHDSNIGVASMDRSFMRREFIIPDGDETTRAVFSELYSQLLAWKPNVSPKIITQDAVMALWFAWKRWMETRRSLHTDEADARNHTIRRHGLPYSPAPGRLSDMKVSTTAGRR